MRWMTVSGVALSSLVALSGAKAELTKCNGVWTNNSCDSGASRTLDADDKTLGTEALQELSKKKSLVHELTMRTIEAKRDYNLRFDSDSVEQLCFDRATSLAECKKAVNELDEQIDKKLSSAAALKVRTEEAQKADGNQQPQVENNTVISITQPNYYHRRHLIPRDRRNYPVSPGHYSGSHGSSSTGSSISVGVSGAGGTSANINVGAESHESTHTEIIQPLR